MTAFSSQTRLWGVTFNCSDILASHKWLSERGAAKRLINAVQGGRKIYTLDNKKVGIDVDIAFIDKDAKEDKMAKM